MNPAVALAKLCGVVLLGVMSPGPNFLLLTRAAGRSRSAALATAAGFGLAALTWSSASLLGLSAAFKRLPAIYQCAQCIGAAYLLYLGAKLLLAQRARALQPASQVVGVHSPGSDLRRAFVVNVANPKSAAFYTSVLVAMAPSPAPGWLVGTAILLTGCVSLAWYTSVGLLLSRSAVSAWFMQAKRPLDLAFGAILAVLGGELLLHSLPNLT